MNSDIETFEVTVAHHVSLAKAQASILRVPSVISTHFADVAAKARRELTVVCDAGPWDVDFVMIDVAKIKGVSLKPL